MTPAFVGRRQRAWEPLLYLLPFLVGIGVFTAYPVLNVVWLSFQTDYSVLAGTSSGVGIGNYEQIMSSSVFLGALRNTALYCVVVVPASTVIAIGFAWLLNQENVFKAFFQAAYFMPLVTSVIAVGLAWKWMYNYDFGVINYLLSLVGISPINWLNDPAWGLPALMLYGVWNLLPLSTILILVGLQNIDPRYGVAARVDGASAWRIFRRITLPLLAPTVGLVIVLNLITSSRVFDELFPLFNGKPGVAGSLYTVVYYVYETFYQRWDLGPAAAAAIVLSLIVLALTLVQLAIQKRWRHY